MTPKLASALLSSLLAATLFSGGAAAAAPPAATVWEPVGTEDGVQIYRNRAEAGGVVSFRGEATLAAPPAQVTAALIDQRTAASWMPMVDDRHTLVEFSPTHRIEVTHLAMPWPATDRYIIDEGQVWPLPGGGYRLTVASVTKLEPGWVQPDLVLGTFHPSQFVVTPLDDGRASRLAFELHTEAGGAVPDWLVRLGQRNWPHDFVQGLRAELRRRQGARTGLSAANQ